MRGLEHGESSGKPRHESIIGLNVQGAIDASDLQADVLQRWVVVDIEGGDRLQIVDALQWAKSSVGDEDAVGFIDAGVSEGHLLQRRQSDEAQGWDLCELRKRKLGQLGQSIELKASNGLKGPEGQARKVGGIGDG